MGRLDGGAVAGLLDALAQVRCDEPVAASRVASHG
jgi:hypothetical protein